MIRYENHLGIIDISHDFLANLVGSVATKCFGVAKMAVTNRQKGILGILRKEGSMDQGVKIRVKNSSLVIDLHIIVLYGVNMTAVVNSIINKVTYAVEDTTGFKVKKVNVFIDGIKPE